MNLPLSTEAFDRLHDKLATYLQGRDVCVKDAYACADPTYRLNLRVVAELPSSAMFSANMFLRPPRSELNSFP